MRKQYQGMKKDAANAGDYEKAGYYDRLQYVYKIKLNSLYGALTNLYFRFYDLRMGESTTATGRAILRHQCRTVALTLEGTYDVNFPMYTDLDGAAEMGYDEDEARMVSLNGPYFNGKHQSDSVIYGDTDSTYFKTYAQTPEEAIAIADAIADKVNASYPEFMRNTFLCTTGYDNIIKAGREIVSDRGIFVEKKRYILHLIDLDGKTVDKLKVMGLDTKKTTLPAEVSKKLNGFIERFLKGESWEEISVSIVEYKEELKNATDLMRIGMPKGVNKIEEYTTKYADKGKTARLPGHVAASIYYNESLITYKDNISTPISSGMKIKVFYLIGNHGKFKSIAIPTDSEVIPQWFLDHFRVDREAHVERLVDNPLNNILKAIGKEPPSKQSLFVDSLLVF
jgi:DNA polymerase elongation subunit (family B)